MQATRNEIFYVLFLVVTSAVFLQLEGVYFPNGNRVEIKNLDFKTAQNIIYSSVDVQPKNVLGSFAGGWLYTENAKDSHSDFYNGNISLFKTSEYWQYPINNSHSELMVLGKEDSSVLQLFLEEKRSLPVISLVTEPDGLFSYQKGIYVSGFSGDFKKSIPFFPFPWHKPANFNEKVNDTREVFWSYFDEKGIHQYSSYAEIEISGHATRCFPQKSLRLSANSKYGNKSFDYGFFKDNHKYSSLILRNGGNDQTQSMLRDMIMETVLEPLGVMVSGYIPCEVYLNGQYWGVHFLQNRIDVNFISEKLNVKKKQVTLVVNWEFEKGDERLYSDLMNLIKEESLTYAVISEVIDMDNLAKYLAGEIYFGNTDWPHNNLKMYRTNTGTAQKWQFVFCDLDYGFAYLGEDAIKVDMFEYLNSRNDQFSKLYKQVVKTPEFKNKLATEILFLLNDACSESNLAKTINFWFSRFEKVMPLHIERWGNPESFESWKAEVQLLHRFAEARGAIVRKQIKKHLGYGN